MSISDFICGVWGRCLPLSPVLSDSEAPPTTVLSPAPTLRSLVLLFVLQAPSHSSFLEPLAVPLKRCRPQTPNVTRDQSRPTWLKSSREELPGCLQAQPKT